MWLLFGGGLLAASIVLLIVRKLFDRSDSTEDEPEVFPPDTVILRQIMRGPYAPSLSPMCIKLETFLRMAKIKYQNVESMKFSSKGKIPWIQLNGEKVEDSEFCIEFLKKKYSVNVNRGLTTRDMAIGRAFQKMVDENLYWVIVLDRWVYQINKDWIVEGEASEFAPEFIPLAKAEAKGHGIGRHSQEEVYRIMEGDMRALSDFLGNKEFFMGREPTEVDCAIFGELSQFLWNMHGSRGQKLMKEELTNLCSYCERMKERFWPDWDECTLKGKRPTASE